MFTHIHTHTYLSTGGVSEILTMREGEWGGMRGNGKWRETGIHQQVKMENVATTFKGEENGRTLGQGTHLSQSHFPLSHSSGGRRPSPGLLLQNLVEKGGANQASEGIRQTGHFLGLTKPMRGRAQGCIGRGGGRPPSRAPSLRPATVPLTASASFDGICNRQ